MSGYTGAGPGAGMSGGVGAGAMPVDTSALANAGAASPFQQVGSRFPQYGMQGSGGAPMGMGVNAPSTVQHMQGGYGISPQLLQMIAKLQTQPAQGQQPFNVAQFQPKPFTPAPRPGGGMLAGYGNNSYAR